MRQWRQMVWRRKSLPRLAKVTSSLPVLHQQTRQPVISAIFSPDTSFPGLQARLASVLTSEPMRVSEARLSSVGLFRPLREANSPTSSVGSMQLSFNRKTPYTSFTTPTMSPLTSIREESNKSPSSPAKPLNITRRSLNQPEKLDEFGRKVKGRSLHCLKRRSRMMVVVVENSSCILRRDSPLSRRAWRRRSHQT